MGVKLQLSEVVFLRLSAGHPTWLSELRWPEHVLELMDSSRQLAAEVAQAERAAETHVSNFSPDEWASLRTWMKRAIAKPDLGVPRLLLSNSRAHRTFHSLVASTKRLDALNERLCKILDYYEQTLQQSAFERLADPRVQLIVANASSDFTAAITKADGSNLARKDRRRLARTLWALLARSTYKSCPLAFAADTGVLLLRGGAETHLHIGITPYLMVLPNQELANELIQRLRPLDSYLAAGKLGLHLNVAAHVDGQDIRVWRSRLDGAGATVRESLTAIRLPQFAAEVLGAVLNTDERLPDSYLTGPALDVIQKLVDEQILVRDDLVTPVDGDPWHAVAQAVADADGERAAELVQRVAVMEHFWQRYTTPQPVADGEEPTVAAALSAARQLGSAVIGPDRIASASVSADTFRQVAGDISADDLEDVRQAVEQYFAFGAMVYPMTPTYRKRRAFIDFFCGKYSEDVPVHLESMLVDDWSAINSTLSFLLDPGDSPIHPDSDLVWPEPSANEGAYTEFYSSLQDAAASGQARFDIAPIDASNVALLSQCQSTMDAICRLGRSEDGRLDVFVESATFSGRLVARHLRAVNGGLGAEASAAGKRYLLGGREPVTEVVSAGIIASHTVPRLQNLSRVAVNGQSMLTLTEPAPAMPTGLSIRYSDLWVRFDSARQCFVIMQGPAGPETTFSWLSPLSPSFSRRLHFLRFLALSAEPVITAPRWLAAEAVKGGSMPRTSVGRLVLSPRRWAVPIQVLSAYQAATGPRRHIELHAVRRDLGLPAEAFVYTAADTRPSYIDFESPFGNDVFGRLVGQAVRSRSNSVLVEERFPAPGREVVDTPSGSASMVFQCVMSPDPKG